MLYNNLADLVGNTPLFKLEKLAKELNLDAEIYAKLEGFNPAGSIKDRAALYMIDDAEKKGLLKPGATIIEPTSGNTGIGLAALGGARGYKVILTMPDTMSVERRKLLAAYGAELVLTDGSLGMTGAIAKAEELREKIPGSIIAGQFINPANAKAHIETTGPEIWRDLNGKIDAFVAGVGTGGTLTGCGKYLKDKNKDILVCAVEPDTSAVLSGNPAGAHKLQGIGAGFIPEILDKDVIDKVICASAEDAKKMVRLAAKCESLLIGISGGAALFGAIKLAYEGKFKKIVTVFPDLGDRYLSTYLYEE